MEEKYFEDSTSDIDRRLEQNRERLNKLCDDCIDLRQEIGASDPVIKASREFDDLVGQIYKEGKNTDN